ncbi:MAG: SDR family NAD(P)-dependent oxidoreductase, partial [Deltaproteobacteria bacterium]|nr:SDR family NAD(P)-dependent oxidoreductase [Deltaproteobacteria bacterium]
FFNMARKGTAWTFGNPESRFNPIHGADLAAFIVQCIQDPDAWGKSHDVGGPDLLSFSEIAALAFSALDKPVKIKRLPTWMIKVVPPLISPFNPFVADLIRSIIVMAQDGAEAPAFGCRHLAEFYEELARTPG